MVMSRRGSEAGVGAAVVALAQAGLLRRSVPGQRSYRTVRLSVGEGEGPLGGAEEACWMGDDGAKDWGLQNFNDTPLRVLVGTWTCQLGSTYYVTPDITKNGKSCSVKTVRKSGRMRVTRALIKENRSRRAGDALVTWGRGFVLETSRGFPDQLTWVPRRINGKPFYWVRAERWGSGGAASVPIKPRKSGRFSSRRASMCSTRASLSTLATGPRMSTDPEWRSSYGSARMIETQNFSRDEPPSPRGEFAEEELATPEELAALALREEQLEVRAATLRLREATVNLQEAQSAKFKLDAARDERLAVTKEASALAKKRETEKGLIAEFQKEESRMRSKLKRCRQVVATTVSSIDLMLREPGEQEDDAHEALAAAREEAEVASAQAASMLVSLGAQEDEARGARSFPLMAAAAAGSSSGFEAPFKHQ